MRVGVISVVGDFHGERQTSSSNTRSRSRARRHVNYGRENRHRTFPPLPIYRRNVATLPNLLRRGNKNRLRVPMKLSFSV